jgi:gamma-glutamyltranspeptidase / glutathione hydrolase
VNVRPPFQPAVSTAFPLATDAACEVLRAGGNAADAAVAAGFALAVCEPSASGLGGQATALLRQADGTVRVVDGHSHAPRGASEESVSEEQQRRGRRSSTVPSMPATLGHLHRRYGRLGWARVLAPAVSLAERGYAITPLQQKQIGWVARWLREDPAAAAIFLRDGQPPPAGALLHQPRLAATLQRLAVAGADDFYRGALARDVAEDMRAGGGLLDEEDLARFAGPVERAPLRARYRGLEVVTAPPPGGGLTLAVALALLERLAPPGADCAPDAWYEAVALAVYGAFRAREEQPLGSDELGPEQVGELLGEERIGRLARALAGAARLGGAAAEEPGDTTHLSVADGEGNVVALTLSIQSVFGAKVANAKLGFLYNNYLRTCPRHAHPARLGPGSPSRSNAAPTLVLGPRGRPLLALGSAGSRRITSSLVQVVSNVVDRGMLVDEAIAAPRVHALLSGTVWLESRAATAPLLERLGARFTKVVTKVPYSFGMGAVHGLQLFAGAALAGADPRRDGAGAVLPLLSEPKP